MQSSRNKNCTIVQNDFEAGQQAEQVITLYVARQGALTVDGNSVINSLPQLLIGREIASPGRVERFAVECFVG